MFKTYVKKPVIIKAIQWTGDNTKEIINFGGLTNSGHPLIMNFEKGNLIVSTLEGYMKAYPGDYILRGIKGEIYPCRKDIFEESYEEIIKVDENELV